MSNRRLGITAIIQQISELESGWVGNKKGEEEVYK
jgi:hypothetical protein